MAAILVPDMKVGLGQREMHLDPARWLWKS